MNIIARIVGVSIYFFTLIIICFLLRKCKKENVNRILFIYSILLSLMGFFFVPNIHNDLYRVYEIMNGYSIIPFKSFFENYVLKSSVPISLLYYWMIGQLKINGLLPFITSFIFYTNVFYIIGDYYKKNNISNKALGLSLLIIMCNSSFFETISGIRNMLAFSIILRCFYDEFYNNKSIVKNIIWYVVSSLIHPAAIIPIFLRLIFSLIEKKSSSKLKVLIPVLSVGVLVFLYYFGFSFIQNAINMGENYINKVEYSYIWETILSCLIIVALIFMKIRCKKFTFLENRTGLLNNKNLSRIIELMTILFIFEHSIFFRYSNFNLFFNIPIIMVYCNELYNNKNKNYRLVFLYFISLLIITCIRGNLCSLKFWE